MFDLLMIVLYISHHALLYCLFVLLLVGLLFLNNVLS